MAAELDGMRIATLEARMTGALASLISKRGGEPLCAPALREAPLDCAEDVRYLLDKLESEELDVVVFQTGVGREGAVQGGGQAGEITVSAVGAAWRYDGVVEVRSRLLR